jgi:hypothetical protein
MHCHIRGCLDCSCSGVRGTTCPARTRCCRNRRRYRCTRRGSRVDRSGSSSCRPSRLHPPRCRPLPRCPRRLAILHCRHWQLRPRRCRMHRHRRSVPPACPPQAACRGSKSARRHRSKCRLDNPPGWCRQRSRWGSRRGKRPTSETTRSQRRPRPIGVQQAWLHASWPSFSRRHRYGQTAASFRRHS